MQLRIHDTLHNTLDFINNSVPGSLKFSNDSITKNLDTPIETFNLTIHKFSNGVLNDRIKFIMVGGYISFVYNGQDYDFVIRDIEEDDYTLELSLESSSTGLLNEQFFEYENEDKEYTLEEYISILRLFENNHIELGTNQLAGKKKAISFSSDGTCISRMMSLASEFDGEIEIKTVLYPNGDFKKFVANFYKKPTATSRTTGIGKDRTDIQLFFGRDLKGVRVKTTGKNLFNAIRLKDKNGKYFKASEPKKILAPDGHTVEIFVDRNSHTIYAPISMMKYPSTTKKNSCDNWTVREVKTDFETEEAMYIYGVEMLQRYMYPVQTYNIDVNAYNLFKHYKANLGDYIYASNPNFIDGMLLGFRISKVTFSLTNETVGSVEVTNAVRYKSKISSSLTSLMNDLHRKYRQYSLSVSTDNGLTFKKDIQSTTIKPTLMQELAPLVKDVIFEFYLNGVFYKRAKELKITSGEIPGETAVIKITAFHGTNEVAWNEITLTKVFDGTSPILTVINSTRGNVFKNGDINTVLKASLWRNDREIDLDGTQFGYSWSKSNSDGTPDTFWNNRYSGVSNKSITVTKNDVFRKAVFTCQIVPL